MNLPTKDNKNWKENELAYCWHLVKDFGDKSVPQESVQSYLFVQAQSALKDGQVAISEALASAASHIQANNWIRARQVLSEVRLKLEYGY